MPAIKTQISTYPLVVDYSKRIKTLVGLGKYDRCEGEIISQKFSTAYKGEVWLEALLVYFDTAITDEDVVTELDKIGLRPGELHELLIFGVQHPEIQCQFPIIALGTIVELGNVCGAPCSSGSKNAGRQLGFTYCGGKWGGGHRFLAFRTCIEL